MFGDVTASNPIVGNQIIVVRVIKPSDGELKRRSRSARARAHADRRASCLVAHCKINKEDYGNILILPPSESLSEVGDMALRRFT